MAHEQIPIQDPAPAQFATKSYAGPVERFFDAQPEVVDIDRPYTLPADTDLPELTAVKYDEATGAITIAKWAAGASDATHLLAQPLQGLSGATGRVALHTSGHWSTRAVIYDVSFDTFDKKERAFSKSPNPMLRASTPKFDNNVIDIPN